VRPLGVRPSVADNRQHRRSMAPIRLDDILGRERYGAVREGVRQRVIEHKRHRRVALGDQVTFVFEDRVTVWYQTQEMLWVESITDLDAIRHELDVYNALLPGVDELSATMLIEITDQARIRPVLESLLGIDRAVWLEANGIRVQGVFEAGRQTERELSAVQYVRFPLSVAAREAVLGTGPLSLVIDHPRYQARAVVPPDVHESLARDLREPESDVALRYVRNGF